MLAKIWEIIQNTLVWKKNHISSIRILVDNNGLRLRIICKFLEV